MDYFFLFTLIKKRNRDPTLYHNIYLSMRHNKHLIGDIFLQLYSDLKEESFLSLKTVILRHVWVWVFLYPLRDFLPFGLKIKLSLFYLSHHLYFYLLFFHFYCYTQM